MKRTTFNTGVVVGILTLYLIVLGITTLGGNLIPGWFNLPTPVIGGWLVLIIVAMSGGAVALWRAVEDIQTASAKEVVLIGVQAGLVHGIIVAFFVVLIASLTVADVPIREWLVRLTPEAVAYFMPNQSPLWGGVLTLFILSLSSVGGAWMRYTSVRQAWRKRLQQQWRHIYANVRQRPKVQSALGHPYAKQIAYGIGFFLLLTAPLYLGRYWNYTLGTVGIYVILGLGLNVVVGMAGMLDLGYVGFFAIGAYTVALLTAPKPHAIMMNFWFALPFAIIAAGFVGMLLGLPVLRMRGDYLAIVTLGFGEIIRILARSDALTAFSGGPRGVRAIGGPVIFGFKMNNEFYFMYFIIISIILVAYITRQLQQSRVGRAWMAIREDVDVAEAMGVNILKYKLLAFMTGAVLAGFAGALYASRNRFAGPEDFTLLVTINVLSLVIIGGMGSVPGVIVGALVLKGLPEILRELDDYRMLVFGALLVIMMILRPEGILPSVRRKMELRKQDEPSVTGGAV